MTTATATPLPTLTADSLLKALSRRYAVKKFDPIRKISSDIWTRLTDVLVLSPSSFGLQPWKFFVVETPEARAKLVPAAWGQRQVVDASHLVVFARTHNLDTAYVDRYLKRIVELRGPSDSVSAYGKMMTDFVAGSREGFDVNAWAARQVYIALGFFLQAAALLGVDACPMEGLVPATWDSVLGIDQKGYRTLCAVAVGYRAADDAYAEAPKVRFPKDQVIETL